MSVAVAFAELLSELQPSFPGASLAEIARGLEEGGLRLANVPHDAPFVVKTVNAAEVRSQSPYAQEFGLVATHLGFPKLIPPGEIWIADNVTASERPFLIDKGRAQLLAMQQGKGHEEAEAYAEKTEAKERRRAKGAPDAHQKDALDQNVPKMPYAAYADENLHPVTVYLVDGEYVRNHVDPDYMEGGHDRVYHYVPHGEIWLEKTLHPDEIPAILLHESHERELMTPGGLSYDEAHQRAAHAEFAFRQNHGAQKVRTSDMQLAQSPPEDGHALASLYAALWTLLGEADMSVTDDERAHASDELEGTGWLVVTDGQEWLAEQEGALNGDLQLADYGIRWQKNRAESKQDLWVPYHGPRAGEGWKNLATGKVIYGGAQPNVTDTDLQKRVEEGRKRRLEIRREQTPPSLSQDMEQQARDDARKLSPAAVALGQKIDKALLRTHGDLAGKRIAELSHMAGLAYAKMPETKGEAKDRLRQLMAIFASLEEKGRRKPKEPGQAQFIPKRSTS